MRTIAALLLLLSLVAVPNARTKFAKSGTTKPKPRTAPNGKTWPHPIPMRSKDSANKDLFVMTLGDVETSLADGIFDPKKDEATLKSGESIKDYYRNKLGIKFYTPVDKTRFALPPSGWCTWYYYYQHITESEVKQNAQWIADNLKDYGAQYVQIDDGWQGTGRGSNRDWSIVSSQFPNGMDKLAAEIKRLGLTPGIWLAPHGQSNETVVKSNPGVFLLKPDGTSASETWEGKWLLDPSNPASLKYMKDLFSKLSGWGYDYFKIDGQPIVVNEYRTKKAAMKNPSDDGNGLYRTTLDTIREAIGPDKYLLGCWGIPVEGMGIMNGSRTGGDIVLGWEGGFMTAVRATMQHYYQHNVAWYADPDVMVLRSPLTVDQARAWATLQGLTGQAMLASDRLMDLSEERVEMMRRVYPAVDIRPLDLFPSDKNKRIWDLKVNHLDRKYDVLGLFNYTEGKPERINLNWKELGLSDNVPMHVFDFWNKEYLGAWENGMSVDLAPSSVRVLTVMPNTDKIQLISTSRHITQGWVDLQSLSRNDATSTFSGKSNVVKNDKYELQFVFPRGKNFKVKSVTARSATGKVPVTIANRQGWSTVQMVSPRTGPVTWSAAFEPAESYVYPVREPTNASIERVGIDGVNVRWSAQYYLNAGYQVYLNGNLMGYTPNNTYVLRGLEPESNYTVEVKTVWDDGKTSEKAAEVKFSLKSLLPRELALTLLEPTRAGARAFEANRTTTGRPFSVAGKHYEAGIGSRSNGEVEFDIKGMYESFQGLVGVDDSNNNDRATLDFVVLGDGKELWRSGQLKKSDAAKAFKVDVKGVRRLVLRISSGEGQGPGGGRGAAANWLETKLTRNE
jgi:hypothetical protein